MRLIQPSQRPDGINAYTDPGRGEEVCNGWKDEAWFGEGTLLFGRRTGQRGRLSEDFKRIPAVGLTWEGMFRITYHSKRLKFHNLTNRATACAFGYIWGFGCPYGAPAYASS